MYPMSDVQYQAVYNTLSFALASMMATTMYLWFRSTAVRDQFKSAVLISGLVTFIAAYHYIRIFNSWVEAYTYSAGKADPELTGVPFNDAYRYMDWLLTVPLLLIEILDVSRIPISPSSSDALTSCPLQESGGSIQRKKGLGSRHAPRGGRWRRNRKGRRGRNRGEGEKGHGGGGGGGGASIAHPSARAHQRSRWGGSRVTNVAFWLKCYRKSGYCLLCMVAERGPPDLAP